MTDARTHLLRFTIKDLLVATVMIAIGLGIVLFVRDWWQPHYRSLLMPCLLWLGSVMLIAGCLYPLKQKLALFCFAFSGLLAAVLSLGGID